jgi:sugar/nucleoside kinase (ribokinase family)
MVLNIFKNGSARAGHATNDSDLVASALKSFGYDVHLIEPTVALHGHSIPTADSFVVTTESETDDHLLETLAAAYPKTPIALRAGLHLLGRLEDILEVHNVEVLHVRGREARMHTQLWPLDDSARELNKYRPSTAVVVTDAAIGVVCLNGHVIKRQSLRIWNPPNDDGLGPAFFAGFLGWYLSHPDDLETCLVAGHAVAALAALGLF